MNAAAKICAVIAFATPIIVITGYAYRQAVGGDLQDAMFKTYSVLQDTPGAGRYSRSLQRGCYTFCILRFCRLRRDIAQQYYTLLRT